MSALKKDNFNEKSLTCIQSEKKCIRSLSLTCKKTPNAQMYRQNPYSYNDAFENCGTYCTINGLEYSIEESDKGKKIRRNSRRRSRHRFYEPSMERFPPRRILRSDFKTLQEMPFWRLDPNRFRRIVLEPKMKLIQEQKIRTEYLTLLPFFNVSVANSKDIFIHCNRDKLQLNILKKEKRLDKVRRQIVKRTVKDACERWKQIKENLSELSEKKKSYNAECVTDTESIRNENYREGGLEILTNTSAQMHPHVLMQDIQKNEIIYMEKAVEETVGDRRNIQNEAMNGKSDILEKNIEFMHKKITIFENSELSKKNEEQVPDQEKKDSTQVSNSRVENNKVAKLSTQNSKQSRPISACSSCERNAYTAESIEALGHIYHNACFKCSTCSTLLQRGSWNHIGDKFFCNPCHRRLSLQTLRH